MSATIATARPRRPIVRYHGGKWRLGTWIISHFPEHRTYVEPFGGGASVLLRKDPCYVEVYNDLDAEVVNLFRVLRDPAASAELERAVALTPFARAEFDSFYAGEHDSPVERARRLLIVSHMGYGTAAMRSSARGIPQRTGFRANTRRTRTTPSHDWTGMPAVIKDVAARMLGVVIEQRPAAQVMRSHDAPDTLHYVDPPYPHSTRCNTARWNYRHELTDNDHRDLAGVLHGLSGYVVLSGYPCDLYDRELYPDWVRIENPATKDGGRPSTEVLWVNAACFNAWGTTTVQVSA